MLCFGLEGLVGLGGYFTAQYTSSAPVRDFTTTVRNMFHRNILRVVEVIWKELSVP